MGRSTIVLAALERNRQFLSKSEQKELEKELVFCASKMFGPRFFLALRRMMIVVKHPAPYKRKRGTELTFAAPIRLKDRRPCAI